MPIQAASSFSALPSVASNVFSSFSKRITGISSRETTPGYETSAADPNGNSNQQQQYQYSAANQPPPDQPFYAPPPLATESTGAAYGFPSGLDPTANPNIPPAEPPKFYTPAEIPQAPPSAAAAPPPSSAGGQNNFRFSAKKKLYAPIPGLSDQQQQQPGQAALFQPAAPLPGAIPPAPFPSTDPYSQTPTYPTEERKSEERKGGLFSKITQLAPAGVLQNITGLVQSAAGTITQTINPNAGSQTPSGNNYEQQYQQPQGGNFGIQFDQQQQQQQVGVGYPLPPPPATNYFATPNYSGEPQANYTPPPPATGESANNQAIHPPPAAIQPVAFFNPQQAGSVPPSGPINFFNPTAAPPSIFDPFKQAESATASQPTQGASTVLSSRPPSQPGQQPPPSASSVPLFTPSTDNQSGVNFFNTSAAAAPPTIFDPFQQNSNSAEPTRPARPSSRPYNTYSEAVPQASSDQQQLRPPSASSQPPSQVDQSATSDSITQPIPEGQTSAPQPTVQFFNPLLVPAVSQPSLTPTSSSAETQQPLRPPSNQAPTLSDNSASQVPATSEQANPTPVQFFNPLQVPPTSSTSSTGGQQPLRPPSTSEVNPTGQSAAANPTPVQFFNPLQAPLGITQPTSTTAAQQPLRPPSNQGPTLGPDNSSSQVPQQATAADSTPVQFFNPLQAPIGVPQPPQTAIPQPLRPPSSNQVPQTSDQVSQPPSSAQAAPVQFFNPLQVPLGGHQAPPTSSPAQEPLRPPSASNQEQPPITFFNPLQQPTTGVVPPVNFFNPLQPSSAPATQPPAGFFDPSQAPQATQFSAPPTTGGSTLPPPSGSSALAPPATGGSALPPPPSGSTSYRLQKGTKLYKNPLTSQETAPAHTLPNPVYGVAGGFATGPQTFNQNSVPPQPSTQYLYQPYNQGFPGPALTQVAN
ncbi:uncharacterized protein LOC133337620, partial [Musca vetustissima]|uniref:uncharacterized protein LOC133337620 n=1 Tax=Musca vetustissima TaxID=27455 RepID=UPI002AB69F52